MSVPSERLFPGLVAYPRPPVQVAAQPASAVIDLKSVLDVLSRRKAWVIGAILACLAALAVYSLGVPVRYTAETRLLIDPDGLQVVDRDVMQRQGGSGDRFVYVESQMRVMTSDRVLGQVAERLGLDVDPEFGALPPSFTTRVKSWLSGDEGRATPPRNKAIRQLEEAVAAVRTQNSYIVDLSVTTLDGEKSARIANAIAEAYMSFEFSERAELAHRASQSLDGRLDELRANLREAEQRVEVFARSNNIVQFARPGELGIASGGVLPEASGTVLSEQQVAQISDQLQAATAATAEAEARYAQVADLAQREVIADSLPEALQSSALIALRDRYAAARQIEASLSQSLGERHARLAAARAQVAAIGGLIGDELDRISRSAREDLDRARQNETNLRAQLSRLETVNADVKDKLVALRELQRNAEVSRRVFEAYMLRAKEVDEQRTINTQVARVLSPALPPSRPAGPSMFVLIALTLAVGAMIGGVLAYLREQLDPSLAGERRFSEITGLPALATLSAARLLRGLRGDAASGRTKGAAERAAPGEAFSVATVIDQFRGRSLGRMPGTLLVTGVEPSQEKSAVALDLGLAAGAAIKRVLIVDADFTHRSLSRLSRKASVGRIGEIDAELFVRYGDMLRDDLNIFILPLDVSEKDGKDSFAPEAICRALQSREHFDLVIVDAPAMGPDPWLARLLSGTDQTVVVAGIGRSDARQLANGVTMLRNLGVTPLGGILVTA